MWIALTDIPTTVPATHPTYGKCSYVTKKLNPGINSHKYHVDRAFDFSQEVIKQLCIAGALDDSTQLDLLNNVLRFLDDLFQIA